LVLFAGVLLGGVVLITALVLLLFADSLVNRYVRPRIMDAVATAYPKSTLRIGGMHYSILSNTFACDSISFIAPDSMSAVTVGAVSVTGIDRWRLLLGGSPVSGALENSVMQLEDIAIDFGISHYSLRCALLRLSVPESLLTADDTRLFLSIGDEEFFAKSRFRHTRFRFDIPMTTIEGLGCLALMHGHSYKARRVTVQDLIADILVNMDKPYDRTSPNPKMPNEVLRELDEEFGIDSLEVRNGTVQYSERYAVGAKPGVVTFDHVNLFAGGMANDTLTADTTLIHGEGRFMNSPIMKLTMALPLTSRTFSMRYSGSLEEMNLTALNVFVESGEHRRIKSGVLHSASFAINVHDGIARGALRVAYEDFTIAVLNDETGSEDGLLDLMASLLGKWFVVRKSNMPGPDGAFVVGSTDYVRDPEDYFLQFAWYSLRNGIADVVGFPKKQLSGKR
jgi:hypothetical protein